MAATSIKDIAEAGKLVKLANISSPGVSEMQVEEDQFYHPDVVKIGKMGILHLVNSVAGAKMYRTTPTGLAALRINLNPEKNTYEYADDFLRNPLLGCRFQACYTKGEEDGHGLGDFVLRVHKRLKLRNYMVPGRTTPLYRDYCYSGIDIYREKLDELGYDWTADNAPEVTAKYYQDRNRLRNILHRTTLFEGFDTEENLDMVPSFVINF